MKKRLYPVIRISALLLCLPFALIGQTTNSVLSSGTFYKISVPEDGIYKLDAAFLSNTAGIDLKNIGASQITLWTNGGGILPQLTTAPRIDDLKEVALFGSGISDGKVDAGDYFLFYGEGPDTWTYDDTEERFKRVKNIYDNVNYYFICVSQRTPNRIAERATETVGGTEISTYDVYTSLDVDKVNLLGKFRPPGSGQRWFGDEFSVTRDRTYTLSLPSLVQGTPVRYTIDFAGRSDVVTSVSAELNGNKLSKAISTVATGNGEALYARIVRLAGTYSGTVEEQEVKITYAQGAGASSGWLDFIELQGTATIQYKGSPLIFRSLASRQYDVSTYVVSGLSGSEMIWDITDRQQPVLQKYTFANGEGRFTITNGFGLREFVVLSSTNAHPAPAGVQRIENQNIHGITDADLVILYHPDFIEAAQRLADHRLTHDGYLVEMVAIDDLMNEYGGGGNDVTAIRDFARILKQRSSRFRFLLLLGDGSYDVRHIHTDQTFESFIPVFETTESMDPIKSFPSDDYLALLSDDEGEDLKGALDIAVGRIPARTAQEANQIIDKLIRYDLSPSALGDWRNKITYIADDEDGNQHLSQTEDVATTQAQEYPTYNLKKIYLDAYQQVITPGGQRYPDVNAAITDAVQNGSLILNYFGHGGPAGWSQERILGNADIQSWTNYHTLPLFITATCSFTAYDEPSLRSAGELVLSNPSGGAVALLTTVRAVYSSSNKRLTSEVFERILLENNGSAMAIGEVMLQAKNSNPLDTVDVNARKFAIIGDPSMKLAIPVNKVFITSVNGHPVDVQAPDTARALELVEMRGEVRDAQGSKLSGFTGTLSVTVFDKPALAKTLGNDPKSYVTDFETQTRVLFKGKVTVTNGTFSFSFVVPQDITFSYGNAKVSLYAEDGTTDANGYFTDLIVGGVNTANADDQGPEIDLWVDYEGFVSGSETGPNPTILIRLRDDSGINITGSSIGHNLEGELDGTSRVLNDLYVSAIDDHTRGAVNLPLYDLEPGLHTYKVTAWDIANNFAEASIDFVVVENPDNVIRNLRNGPNPFSTETEFAFEHQLGNVPMDVSLEIYSSTGVLVQELNWENVLSQGSSVSGLTWNGRTFDGNSVTTGIYLYKVRLTSRPGSAQEQFFESKCGKLIVVN